MDSGLENKVAQYAAGHRLFSGEGKIILAISGGADSLALLHVMAALRAKRVISAELVCGHVNHKLRVGADEDEEFVTAEAGRLSLAVESRSVDVRGYAAREKMSIETAARQLRIECLVEIARSAGCTAVVTAHQKNDNAETVVQRLVRGTGFRGLGGIWPRRTFKNGIRFSRPLLCATRSEIIDYLDGRKLRWRVDETNSDCAYRRNFIRHRLVPEIQRACSGSVVELLSVLAEASQDLSLRVCRGSDEVWRVAAQSEADKVTLDAERLESLPIVIKVELFRRSLVEVGSGERDLCERHYEQMLRLAGENVSGRVIELPGGFLCRREYGKLIFSRGHAKGDNAAAIDECEIAIPGRTTFGGYLIEADVFGIDERKFEQFRAGKDKFVEWFAMEAVKEPLIARFRRDGDRFLPLGLSGEKKLGKFFTAEKVPPEVRDKALVVADSEKIIWVWPVRMSEQVKVTSKTVRILELKVKETN